MSEWLLSNLKRAGVRKKERKKRRNVKETFLIAQQRRLALYKNSCTF